MSNPLAKRRKTELKEMAKNLGLAVDGVREDIADRIKRHVVKHGSSDRSLRDLIREESPRTSGRHSTESSRLANLSSANEDDDTSDGTQTRSMRSSPKKGATKSRRSDSDSESAEDPLSKHQVRNFMDHMQTEIHDATDLAHSLEHTLHEKFQSGKDTLRRASKDFTSTVTHAIDDVVNSVGSGSGSKNDKGKGVRRGSRHQDEDDEDRHSHRHGRRHHHGHHHGEDDEGWCSRIYEEVKHRFGECAGACGFSTCMSRNWQRVHDLGSTSTGFVWITIVLELAVFSSAAYSHHEHHDEGGWMSCLGFITNWPNFLLPFFAYYGTLFVIPTLLSQLFNVDRARKIRNDTDDHNHQHVMTGLLSRTTTSGLSYFVFKFAMTYLLSQYALHHHVSSTSRLAELAKGAAETVASHAGFGHRSDYHLLSACEYVTEIFRFVPASLGLATSGVGTVLALAETVVSRRR